MLSKNYLLPTAYLAPLSYYALIIKSPNSIIEQYEHFKKQTIRSRCSIYSSNGSLVLSVPKVRKSSSKTLIKDIQICYTEPWQKIHWNAIQSSYNSSPFFEYYMDEIFVIYNTKEKYLIDLNLKTHQLILKFLQIDSKINLSNNYNSQTELEDFRDKKFQSINNPVYDQVFSIKKGFTPNLSIIDLVFNLGPESNNYLEKIELSKIF
ncbi:MAG: WbqC family protein [Flavobacteriales bacterium]